MPDRSPFLAAFIRGQAIALHEVWERRGRPIDEREYSYQLRVANWADCEAPDVPEAQPREAVDLRSLPAILPPGVTS